MNYVETILPEFDREMANTRKVLERVPEHKFDWQALPKSHTIGWIANYLAEILGWVEMIGGVRGVLPRFQRVLASQQGFSGLSSARPATFRTPIMPVARRNPLESQPFR